MTGRTFQIYVVLTCVILAVTTVITLIFGVNSFHLVGQDYEKASQAAVPMYIAVAAGWITYCLQRRISYSNALRSLWEKVVDAVQDALQYTYKISPSEDDFVKVMHKLGCRIDDVRSVFRNVDETYVRPDPNSKGYVYQIGRVKTMLELASYTEDFKLNRDHIGKYPFESLKQIRVTINILGYGSQVSPRDRDIARNTIANLWKIMRYELSKELDRDFPAFPDTPYERQKWQVRLRRKLIPLDAIFVNGDRLKKALYLLNVTRLRRHTA